MSQSKAIIPLVDSLPPVLTITPPTLVFPPTPPLTPDSLPCTYPTQAHPQNQPISTYKSTSSETPITPTSPASPPGANAIPIPSDAAHSLHFPLTRHLELMHPNTPKPIVEFIATRLLCPEKPYGHQGPWEPVWEGCGDLATAGVEYDAGKGCKRRNGEGKERDERLREMYEVAKESFRLLELKSPGVDKL